MSQDYVHKKIPQKYGVVTTLLPLILAFLQGGGLAFWQGSPGHAGPSLTWPLPGVDPVGIGVPIGPCHPDHGLTVIAVTVQGKRRM